MNEIDTLALDFLSGGRSVFASDEELADEELNEFVRQLSEKLRAMAPAPEG